MVPDATRAGYRPDIDGLRALAIILVVGYHVGLPGFAGGFIGVDVFFVISGFLISGLLLDSLETSGRISFVDFYARRIRRLLPALAVVVAITLVLGAAFLAPWDVRDLGKSAIAAAFFGSNVYFWRALGGYFGLVAHNQPLLHTWTLAVEEQFYVVWPALLALTWSFARRRGKSPRRLLVGVLLALSTISLLLSAVVSIRNPSASFYLLPTRLWELAAGALLVLLVPRRMSSRVASMSIAFAGVAAIVVSDLVLRGTDGFPGIVAVPLVVGTMACIAAGGEPSNPVSRVLASAPLVAVGKRSYSWYLWHWPLLTIVRLETFRSNLLRDALVALAALGLASLTYTFVEQPVRQRRFAPFRTRRVSLASGAVLIVAVAAGGFAVSQRPQTAMDRARGGGFGCLVLDHALPIRIPGDCVPVSDGNGSLVLLGDSHAAALQPAMEAVAKKLGWRLEVATRVGCPFVVGTGSDCDRSLAATVRYLTRNASRIRGVVINYRSPDFAPGGPVRESTGSQFPATVSTASWLTATREPIRALTVHGIRVLVILPTPEPNIVKLDADPLACLARFSADRCAYPRAKTEAQRAPVAEAEKWAVAGDRLASTWDPATALCDPVSCRVEQNGIPLYRDGDHLSHDGSLTLVPTLLAEIGRAFRTKG